MTNELTIPAAAAVAIAELAVELHCEERAHGRELDALHAAEDRDDCRRDNVEVDRACYLAARRCEDAARKVELRLTQIARFQANMLNGVEAIRADASYEAVAWGDLAEGYGRRADSYRALLAG